MNKAEMKMKLPLFDDYWIDFRRGTTRRWFAPEYHGLAPAGPYCSMFFDPTVGKYRVYYENVMDPDKVSDGERNLYLAESDDLRTFTNVQVNPGSDIFFNAGTGVHGVSVMYDRFETDPARRYKMAGMMEIGAKKEAGNTDWMGVELAFSADGLHFERHPELIASPQTSDALNKLSYNPIDEEYSLFHRSAFVDRRISVRTSKDLKTWSEPHIILNPGAGCNSEACGMQHYSMTGGYFDGIFYGLLWRYETCLYSNDYSRMFGVIEPELVYSYDGHEYMFTTGRAIIERPYPPLPGCAGLAPDDMCLSGDGKDYYIICYGYQVMHGTQESNAILNKKLDAQGIHRGNPIYRVRKDGFCGIESAGMGGTVVTKGICLLDDDLSFNIRANAGSARFGIMNADGSFLPGFEPDNCEPFAYSDSVCVKPAWKDHSLKEVLNRQVRIFVELNCAILHCIEGTARPYVRQCQRSFSHPEGVSFTKQSDQTWGVI